MQRLFSVLFGISLVALAVLVLLAIPSQTPASGMARLLLPVLAPLTVAFFVLRHRAQARIGQGFMKPGTTALTKAQATSMRTVIINNMMTVKTSPNAKGTPRYLVATEISRLTAEWNSSGKAGTQTDAELNSLYLLQRYALDEGSDEQRKALLADVADPAPFLAMRSQVEAIQVGNLSDQQAFAAWKAAVGNTNMTHLLKDGWIPFLRSLPHPDPILWHGVATDFHEIEHGGRLEAAFWILEQPECDRATASDFIRGFVANELFELAVRSGNAARVKTFQEVIHRYNSRFYVWFGIPPDAGDITPISEAVDGPFGDAALAGMISRIARSVGIAPLTAPVNLLLKDDIPDNPMPGLVRSPYDFWDDAGLHLRFPGRNWRQGSSSA